MYRPSWGGQPRPVVLQYIEAVQSLRISAAPDEPRGSSGGSSGGAKEELTTIAVASIRSIELGCDLFPHHGGRQAAVAASVAAASEGGGGFVSRFIQGISRSRGGGSSAGGALPATDLNCLTVVVESPMTAAAASAAREGRKRRSATSSSVSEATTAAAASPLASGAVELIHLQLPGPGNGRSRDEWAHGLTGLMQHIGS